MSIVRAKPVAGSPVRPVSVSPRNLFLRVIDALVEADRRYREARKVARLEYPYLRDMGVDLGRSREDRRR